MFRGTPVKHLLLSADDLALPGLWVCQQEIE